MADETVADDTGELSDGEKRANLIRLAFDNDASKLDRFVQLIKDAIPEYTGVVVRGSAVTGERWKDGAGFDADGPGTSDLDLTGAAESGEKVLNIELSSPFGQAHFEAPAQAMSAFLRRTYQIVPAGQESSYIDIEAELNDLLRKA